MSLQNFQNLLNIFFVCSKSSIMLTNQSQESSFHKFFSIMLLWNAHLLHCTLPLPLFMHHPSSPRMSRCKACPLPTQGLHYVQFLCITCVQVLFKKPLLCEFFINKTHPFPMQSVNFFLKSFLWQTFVSKNVRQNYFEIYAYVELM